MEIQENMWDEVFPLLDQHFFQLIPVHMYECFLDNVLCALEVAGHYDQIGKQLMQYITLFFPKHIKRFRAQRYLELSQEIFQLKPLVLDTLTVC